MEISKVIEFADSNVKVLNVGYHEYLTPKSNLPIYDFNIWIEVDTGVKRWGGKSAKVVLSLLGTIGPETKNPTIRHHIINAYKIKSRTSKYNKRFTNKDIAGLIEKTGVDINGIVNAYHSYLIITSWYHDEASKGSF